MSRSGRRTGDTVSKLFCFVIDLSAKWARALVTCLPFLTFVLNFRNCCKTSYCETSLATLLKKLPRTFNLSPFIKNPPIVITLQFHLLLIKTSLSCINTHVFVLINQYSTGLLVSYFTHEKTQLYKTFPTQHWQKTILAMLILDKTENSCKFCNNSSNNIFFSKIISQLKCKFCFVADAVVAIVSSVDVDFVFGHVVLIVIFMSSFDALKK